MNEDNENLYSLSSLIEQLEIIKKEGEGTLNIPKAIYCLAKEISSIKKYSYEFSLAEEAPKS